MRIGNIADIYRVAQLYRGDRYEPSTRKGLVGVIGGKTLTTDVQVEKDKQRVPKEG